MTKLSRKFKSLTFDPPLSTFHTLGTCRNPALGKTCQGSCLATCFSLTYKISTQRLTSSMFVSQFVVFGGDIVELFSWDLQTEKDLSTEEAASINISQGPVPPQTSLFFLVLGDTESQDYTLTLWAWCSSSQCCLFRYLMTVMRKVKSVGPFALFSLILMLLSCLNITVIIYMHIPSGIWLFYFMSLTVRFFSLSLKVDSTWIIISTTAPIFVLMHHQLDILKEK